MDPSVPFQGARFYNALPGKIIGVFKEQVRNLRFFTLPLAARPALITTFAYVMSRSF